jgi:hypothetical protein
MVEYTTAGFLSVVTKVMVGAVPLKLGSGVV